ncbi:hypothetical protein EJ110_NYTH05878 [Nymphaea thermarum]|nr:hypothetical protein EJ110_NYTH05878 [Nymphaea thermarum]
MDCTNAYSKRDRLLSKKKELYSLLHLEMASAGGSSSYASASLNPASSIQWNAFASLVSVKLDRTNFLMWRSQIKAVMISQDLIKYVDGTCEAPTRTTIGEGNTTTENPAYVMWKRSDQLALSWILAIVSEPVLGQVLHFETAREA